MQLVRIRCIFLSDFYEDSALMLEEEGAVIVGLLVGLNVIDANLCVKGEDLDSQVNAASKHHQTGKWILIHQLFNFNPGNNVYWTKNK